MNGLRSLLRGDGVVHAPGVHDAVTARLAAAAGVRAAHLSGAVVSATALGLPDLGWLSGSDIVARAREIVPGLAGIPLVADADTGYGGPLQVARTVEAYAAAGIAGLHIEDQVSPKRCGHLDGVAVVPLDEAATRIRAATATDADVVVIARTDAYRVEGLQAVVERARAFADAGAEMVFAEGVDDVEGLAAVHDACGLPLLLSRSEAGGGATPAPDATLAACGVRVVIHPVATMLAAAAAARAVYAAVARDGSAGAVERLSWDVLQGLLELDTHRAREDALRGMPV